MSTGASLVIVVLAVLLLWAAVVGLYSAFMAAMVWITSRLFPLAGRRRRRK